MNGMVRYNPNQGYQTPMAERHGALAPVNPNASLNQTQEGRLGQPDYPMPEPGRLEYPEDANAEYGFAMPSALNKIAMAQVPCAIAIQGGFTLDRADYNALANYQYVRDGAAVVGALGRNDQDGQIGTAAGGVFTIPSSSSPNFVLGYMIEWSLQLQTSTAFTLKLRTLGFKGRSWQPLDRRFDLRIGGGRLGDSAGGIFAFLFAQRLDAQYACGYEGGASNMAQTGYGGMMKAIVQPAAIVPYVTNEENSPIFIPGVSLETNTIGPKIEVEVPAALAAGFGVVGRPITAASPHLALLRAALNMDRPLQSAA
jgi:hypothetical protein